MTAPQAASSIEVAIRVRPLRDELRESKPAWQIDATSLTELAQPDNVFTFDRVYNSDASTAQVYKDNVRDAIVARVAQGYNGTVFAYGQTGSGKSYTMFGDLAGRSPGLIRLAVHDLFKALAAEQQRKPYMHTEVFVSVLEIYNEQLRDLLQGEAANGGGGAAVRTPTGVSSPLAPSPPPLSIRENEYGVYVHNALRTQVSSEQHCAEVINTHAASRVSAATMMNEHSSRSHCVIRILVERSHFLEDAVSEMEEDDMDDDDETATQADEDDDDDGRASSTHTGVSGGKRGSGAKKAAAAAGAANKHKKKIISTLNMVDLAGSERVAKTGATGLRMIEGGHINKSLTTLTTVINRLAADGANSRHQHHNSAAGAMPARSSSGGGGGAASSFIPYRDSRLTHLLKTAIGGNSFTAVLCCITPAIESANESRSTLQFASRAKKIKNKVRVNEVANVHTRVRELEAALRNTKKLMVAQTLYLWSKQLKIRKYEAQLSNTSGTNSGVAGTAAGAASWLKDLLPADGRRGSSSPATQHGSPGLMNQQQQQSMIIAQLTAQNGALRDQVASLQKQLEKASTASEQLQQRGPSAPANTAAELASVRHTLESTQRLLKERETALQAAQASLDELDGLCRELESENKAQAEQLKSFAGRNTEAEELMTALEEEQGSLQHEVGLLRTQLQQSQAKLLEKHRGDGYVAELTKLHVEHQNLQFSYTQLKEKADRDKAELMQRLQRLTEQNNGLEDDLDEAKDHAQVLNSYLWRLLSAFAQVSQGKPLQIKDPSATVRESQVTEAVRGLTSFAAMSEAQHLRSVAESASSPPAGESTLQLQSRIRALEEQLVAKDAQRDVVIDTKLKRIQGLVLRLHTVNVALVGEMQRCFRDNELLFDIATKSSKTQKKVEKAGLAQRSLEAALDRARFAQPPHKPLYHN